MRICPECGSTKIAENGEVVCTRCGLVLKERDVTRQRIEDNFTITDRDEHAYPLLPFSVWVREQQRLAAQLGLTKIHNQIGHTCSICGKPAKKGSKLDLCESHAQLWKRNLARLRKQKQRAKAKQNVTQ